MHGEAGPGQPAGGLLEHVGTRGYIAPETAQGDGTDTRADVFALGVVLYQMVTGNHPFEGDNELESVRRMLRGEAPPLERFAPNVPPELPGIVTRCLCPLPGERYGSAHEVRMALGFLLSQLGVADGSLLLKRTISSVFGPDLGSPDARPWQESKATAFPNAWARETNYSHWLQALAAVDATSDITERGRPPLEGGSAPTLPSAAAARGDEDARSVPPPDNAFLPPDPPPPRPDRPVRVPLAPAPLRTSPRPRRFVDPLPPPEVASPQPPPPEVTPPEPPPPAEPAPPPRAEVSDDPPAAARLWLPLLIGALALVAGLWRIWPSPPEPVVQTPPPARVTPRPAPPLDTPPPRPVSTPAPPPSPTPTPRAAPTPAPSVAPPGSTPALAPRTPTPTPTPEPAPVETPPAGVLVVTSVPTGAQVELDGQSLGTTPLRLERAVLYLTVRAPGHAPKAALVKFKAERAERGFTLEPSQE